MSVNKNKLSVQAPNRGLGPIKPSIHTVDTIHRQCTSTTRAHARPSITFSTFRSHKVSWGLPDTGTISHVPAPKYEQTVYIAIHRVKPTRCETGKKPQPARCTNTRAYLSGPWPIGIDSIRHVPCPNMTMEKRTGEHQ